MAHIIHLGFCEERKKHLRSNPQIWIRVEKHGLVAHVTWATSSPRYGDCFSVSKERLILLHTWLMSHCYVGLGDRVWKHEQRIPMEFLCSPLWCNIYLLHYEMSFVQRLAKLGLPDLLQKVQIWLPLH